MKIKHCGQLKTIFYSLIKVTLVVIKNVAYVESFIISLISQSIFYTKRVHFDSGGPRLYKDNATQYFLHQINSHYVFTTNGVSFSYLDNACKILTALITVASFFFIKIKLEQVYTSSKTFSHLKNIHKTP